jgi:ATP-dependent Lon protease
MHAATLGLKIALHRSNHEGVIEQIQSARGDADPGMLADSVAPLLSVGIDQRQQLLEITDVVARLEKILELLRVGQQAA